VFADIRTRLPFVPALFRSLADDPDALLAAWLQARVLLDDPASRAAGARLAEQGRAELAYRPSRRAREATEPFRQELPVLLLVVWSLVLALEGELDRAELPEPALPPPAPIPESPVRELAGEHPLYPEIRAVYGTEHLPVLFRALAAERLLEEVWGGVGPYLGSPAGREHAERLAEAAGREAREVTELAYFGHESGRPILAQLQRALPRNLIVATAATRVD
jgi:hypothetical protein